MYNLLKFIHPRRNQAVIRNRRGNSEGIGLMWLDLVMISLWGGIVALDTTAAMQILVSRPIVSCTITGLLLGNPATGLLMGLVFELLYLDELPVGGAMFTEGNIGATIAAGLGILLERETGRPDLALPLAVVAGILMSMAGAHMVLLLRLFNGRVYTRLLTLKRITFFTINRYHLICVLMMFLAGVLITFAGIYIFYLLFGALAGLIPAAFDQHLNTIFYALLGVGCAVLIHIFYERKHWLYLAGGAGAALLIWLLTWLRSGGV